MPKKPSLQTYVSKETKAKFAAAARSYGCDNEAQFLRVMIDHVLQNAPPVSAELRRAGGNRVQVNIGLTPDEHRQVVQLAGQQGIGRTTWIVNLIRAHVTREPQFAPLEVDGLMESNRQLAAIGRNLNQIARHLNLNLNASYPVSEVIVELAQEIKQHRTKVAGLMDANLNRWGMPK
jgi:hypothetical protein